MLLMGISNGLLFDGQVSKLLVKSLGERLTLDFTLTPKQMSVGFVITQPIAVPIGLVFQSDEQHA